MPRSERMTVMKCVQVDSRRGRDAVVVRSWAVVSRQVRSEEGMGLP